VARAGNSRRGRIVLVRIMIVRYTELPESTGSEPRPLVDVAVADVDSVLVPCLVDSGALNSLLPRWAAEVAAVDLSGTTERRIGLGGATTSARFAAVTLSTADLAWEASVGFCDPWPYAWGLLGHHSFFRWFTITFRAVDHEFEIDPIER
jgi:hypothetical protein